MRTHSIHGGGPGGLALPDLLDPPGRGVGKPAFPTRQPVTRLLP